MYRINDHIIRKTTNVFGGSEKKETVFLDDGNMYLLKLPDPIRETGRSISYINNAFSEYLGCKIFKEAKIPVQEVILGEYETVSSHGEMKTYIACLCRNLEEDRYKLAPAEVTALSSDGGRQLAARPGFESLRKITGCIDDVSSDSITNFYAEMFVVDAFIGNTDRHNGNWGFLVGPDDSKIAPVYDCGSSLCPLIGDSEMDELTAVREAMNGMSVMQDGGKRVEYRSFLMSGHNSDVNRALGRIVPRIQMNRIIKIVEDMPYASTKRKDFYIKFLMTKYERVLVPALENVLESNISHSNRDDYNQEIQGQYTRIRNELSEIPAGERKSASMNGKQIEVIHAVSNKYILIDSASGEADAVVTLRSRYGNSWKLLETLSQTYNIPPEDVEIRFGAGIDRTTQSLTNSPAYTAPKRLKR